MGWGGVGGVVQTDYLVEPRLSWTGLGCDNYIYIQLHLFFKDYNAM